MILWAPVLTLPLNPSVVPPPPPPLLQLANGSFLGAADHTVGNLDMYTVGLTCTWWGVDQCAGG